MEVGTLVSVLRPLLDRAQPEWKKEQQGLRRRFLDESARGIADHHIYVSRWCQEAHSVLLGGIDAEAPTVDLSFQTMPRRLGIGGEELDEIDVLLTSRHVALLGDPGAGKTTTLRRLAQFVALEPPTDADDDFHFAIVVVCRDENWAKDSIYDVLGKRTGITGKLAAELDNPESRIREILNAGGLILIDGLDEVPPRYRGALEQSIMQLGRHLTRAKLIASCRSADYVAPLEGFDIAEIRPLSSDQIDKISEALLGVEDARSFNEAIQNPQHPAADLTDRPLFLTQLLAIYKVRGTIPERPIDLYESITRLILQEWDEQRGVRRVSKYGQFGIDDKRRFLADLAYELIRRDLLRFEESDLAEVYKGLAERYSLPKAQARMVARELESHTGLIVESGDFFEFSHLSLQEFLAADAMVRGPASAHADWWSTYPAVAAIATAMSSDADAWFKELTQSLPRELEDIRLVQSFLYRLGQERPRFVRSPEFGMQLLRVLVRSRVSDPDVVTRLGAIKSVRDSVADALAAFDSVRIGGNETRLARYQERSESPVEAVALSTAVLRTVLGPDRFREFEAAAKGRSN